MITQEELDKAGLTENVLAPIRRTLNGLQGFDKISPENIVSRTDNIINAIKSLYVKFGGSEARAKEIFSNASNITEVLDRLAARDKGPGFFGSKSASTLTLDLLKHYPTGERNRSVVDFHLMLKNNEKYREPSQQMRAGVVPK